MNLVLSPEEKTADPVQAGAAVHAVLPGAAHENKIAALLEAAENEEQKRRFVYRFGRPISSLFAVVMCAGLVAHLGALLLHGQPSLQKVIWAFIVVDMAVNAAFNAVLRRWRISHRKKRYALLADLMQYPDEPRSLLVLVDALHLKRTPEWKSLLYPTLTERLWGLPATDASLWLDDTRRALLRFILTDAYLLLPNGKRKVVPPGYFDDVTTDLAVALMKTLAGLGDKKSVKVLEKIIKAEAVTPNETVVRDAAREYLPVLVKKSTENEAVQETLRLCLEEKIRDPDKVLEEFINTLAPEPTKAVLTEFLRKEQHNNKIKTAFAVGCMIFALAPIIRGTSYNTVVLLCAVCVHLAFCTAVLFSNKISHLQSNAQKVAYELSRNTGNDTRLLPVLLEAAQNGRNTVQADSVKKALARLLPLLRPGDAALVPPAQLAILRTWLKTPRSKKKAGDSSQTLTIAALDALAALGDTKALPAARHIARQTLRGNYHEAELHEAALRCVEALEVRKAHN